MAQLGITSILIVLFAVTLPIKAIQDQEQPRLSGYAIEITNQSGQSTHFLIAGRELKGAGSFTLPSREIIKRADKDSEQVSMITVAASSEKDAWRIKVSVVKGDFYDKGEQDVATYLVRESEKVTVKEMGQFGIKSFDIAVVRINQSGAIQPSIRNRTESIAVINVEATTIPSPYRIFMRNLSYKDVFALEVTTYSGDQRLLLKWPQGTWDHPLIEPGGTYEEDMPSAGKGQTTSFGYVPEQSTGIEIGTVVFTDGTYEGKPYLAAVAKAQVMGSKTQLKRVMSLLQTVWESADNTDVDALTALKEGVSLLSEDVDPGQLQELQRQFPTLDDGGRNNLAGFVKWGLHNVKATLLKEIEALQKQGQRTSGSSVMEWIPKTKDKYERWFSAL